MTKGEDSHAEMAHARHSDGITVIFDQNSPASSRSPSRSSHGGSLSSGSGRSRGRGSHRRRYRSSSASSSSSSSRRRSSSHSRSRSHPRCHRRSSRCRCDNHHRCGRGCHHRRSPPRRYRANSRSCSRSPTLGRHARHMRNRSRSSRRYKRSERRSGCRLSPSPVRSHRSRSRSRSSGNSLSPSLDDKREVNTVKVNAMKILGVEKLELPENVKPILSEQLSEVESIQVSPEPDTRVRQDPEKTWSQSSEEEPDDVSSPKMSPKRKIISFSINNCVARPTAVAPTCVKVTPRVDSYESRKPYGHWVPVKSGKSSKARKHTLAKLH